MKNVLAIAVAMVSTASVAQVTYRTTGATVAKVVSEVAKSSDAKLAVHRDLAKEIVVVSVKGVDLEEFKKRLADCVSGKWVMKDDEVLELVVDSSLSNERRKAAQAKYADLIAEMIKSTRKELQPSEPEEWSGGELPLDIVESIARSHYEQLLPNGRIVFSSSPNRLQRQLPDITALLKKYMPEVAGTAPHCIFAIERSGSNDYTIVTMTISGDAGGAYSFLSLGDGQRAGQPILSGKQINWSLVATELSKRFGNWSDRAIGGLLTIPQFVLDVLAKPTVVDPMSFSFGEGILACADERGENVIASIADDDVPGDFGVLGAGTTTGEFWRVIKEGAAYSAERTDGWISVRPSDPIGAREMRGDRVALEKLIGKAHGNVWPSLDDLAEFAASNLECDELPAAFVMPFQVMVNYYGQSSYGFVPRKLRPLQVYGILPTSIRIRLKNGERVAIGSLPPKAKQVIDAIIFGPTHLQSGWSDGSEPTEVMPNGLPSDAVLNVGVSQAILLVPLPDAGESTMPPRGLSPEEFGYLTWLKKSSDDPGADDVPEITRARIGSRKTWEFTVELPTVTAAAFSLAEDSVSKGATATTMEELPASIRQVLDKAYEDFVKRMGAADNADPVGCRRREAAARPYSPG